MKITLCGSAKFENEFKKMNERLTLAGHVVYTLSVYPSDKNEKSWYTPQQKEILDAVHKEKINNSDAVYIIAPGGYIGESTKSEIQHAVASGKLIMCQYPLNFYPLPNFKRTCPHVGCSDPTKQQPCGLCYE